MCSEKRLLANRLNAQKSTGPITPKGKLRSSQNALKHGLHSSSLLPSESQASYQTFCQEMLTCLQPHGPIETALAQRITQLTWRIRRIPAAEAEIYHQLNLRRQDAPPFNPAEHLAIAFLTQDDKTNPFLRLQRYETCLQRSLDSAIRQLAALQHHRRSHTDDEFDTTNDEPQTTNNWQNESNAMPHANPIPTAANANTKPTALLRSPHVQRILRDAVAGDRESTDMVAALTGG